MQMKHRRGTDHQSDVPTINEALKQISRTQL